MDGRHRTVLVLLGALVSGCSEGRFSACLLVIDEDGVPLEGATVIVPGQAVHSASDGTACVEMDRPTLAVVSSPDHLSEPVPMGVGSTDEPVRLFRAAGRFAAHFTGDVMFGRRYQAPTTGSALVPAGDGGAGALRLVSDVAPLLRMADFSSTNLETVVGSLPDTAAYPAKRWLLQSPVDALLALGGLGVDAVSLANNHQLDWLEEGLRSTLTSLDALGLPYLGAGLDEEDANEPLGLVVGGQRVGLLAWTSVDGDYVNDQYPSDDEPVPATVSSTDAFKWERRTWGAPEVGIDVEARRIGGAWQAIADVEEDLDDGAMATLWASAVGVYPELQDWVARRGHGGAAFWDDESVNRVATLAEEADLVFVQLHMGYQFAAAPGGTAIEAAHAAIDAGADLVICHHPHVLQGFEWYQGRLIAYSLGNFIFDQDFLTTFPSAVLRTVWEGTELLEARVVPIYLDAYRPVPITGDLARSVGAGLWEDSLLPAVADRGDDLVVRSVLDEARASPGFRFEHGTYVLGETLPVAGTRPVSVPAGGLTPLSREGLVRTRLTDDPPADLAVGRPASSLGSFEDEDADAEDLDVTGWTWSSSDVTVEVDDPLSGARSLCLLRDDANSSKVSARMTARVMLPAHRLYTDEDGAEPLDGDASWSVHLTSRWEGDVRAEARLAMYWFDDLDPTEDPESTLLADVLLPVPEEGEVLLDIPGTALLPVDGVVPNAALLYLSLSPPASGWSRVCFDDVEVVEWRAASAEPEGWADIGWIRSGGAAFEGEVDVLPW